MDLKFNINKEDIATEEVSVDFADRWKRARSMMRMRTRGFDLYTRVSHNQSLYEKKKTDVFSEGSTQAIKRKIRAQTLQRIPDGEVVTQFDKNSIEQVETEFIFKNKILRSEYQNQDMFKNLWKSFGEAYDYGFSCVRTGFELDLNHEYRVTYTNIRWNDIYPAPDCNFIEEADWYIVREWMSISELEQLLDEEGNCKDSTYNENVVQYLVETGTPSGVEVDSLQWADRKKAAMPTESVEIRTLYKKGDKTFKTYVPSLNAILREVDNYDPRLDVPLHFLILDPDPEFPLGASTIMWTLAQQQFADTFQTCSNDTLVMATQPPLMAFGNLTPSKIKMAPRAFWPMGTNPNNKIEKFPVETTTVTQYGSILENVQSRMLAALNIQDGTIATDAETMGYSKTAQGVQAQRQDKTITVNQYQKRIEIFFSEWANHALRSYINAMGGTHELTVDEETRRRIWDIEMSKADPTNPDMEDSIIDDDKIKIDFDGLSTDMLEFIVRTGSLIESEKEVELQRIQEVIVPISQMLGAVGDDNKADFENVLMMLLARFLEMSDIDISAQTSSSINEKLLLGAMQSTMEQVMGQQGQIDQMGQQISQLQGAAQPGAGQMPASAPAQEQMPTETGMPEQQPMPEQPMPEQGMPPATGMPAEGAGMEEQMPPEATAGGAPEQQIPPEIMQQLAMAQAQAQAPGAEIPAGAAGAPAAGGLPPERMQR